MGERTRPKLEDGIRLFEGLGFKTVHTWNESHGDGGTTFMQNRAEIGAVVSLSFDRAGTLLYVRMDPVTSSGHDHLLAEELKRREDEFVRLAKTVSSCATMAHYDIQSKLSPQERFRVFEVAGHGQWAHRHKLYHCSECSTDAPVEFVGDECELFLCTRCEKTFDYGHSMEGQQND